MSQADEIVTKVSDVFMYGWFIYLVYPLFAGIALATFSMYLNSYNLPVFCFLFILYCNAASTVRALTTRTAIISYNIINGNMVLLGALLSYVFGPIPSVISISTITLVLHGFSPARILDLTNKFFIIFDYLLGNSSSKK